MRILNAESLSSHGNARGRQAVLQILEAGLQAADPYHNTRHLVRIEGNRLVVGGADFEPAGDPNGGQDAIYDLDTLGRIYVFGAGKGIQRCALALEEVLGDRLTAGVVIAKHDDDPELSRIEVVYGAHPVPDEGCVRGCQRILEVIQEANLQPNDLVFTLAGNGISSLLTLPAPGITLDEVRQVTYMMQIARGVPTGDLNAIRNHIDSMKSGRISRYIQPAQAVHIIAVDPSSWQQLMYANRWLHNLPEASTYADAIRVFKKWDAWSEAPDSVRNFLEVADPAQDTVRADEFFGWKTRVFGTMPRKLDPVEIARQKAAELGFTPHVLTTDLRLEAREAGRAVAYIATNVEKNGEPFEAPCAIITRGEMLVTVGKETGVGGRNQEFCLSAAGVIAGSERIVIGSVDTDGTDGPGCQFSQGGETIPCLAGAIVDGTTHARVRAAGLDYDAELKRHNTTLPLWKSQSGVLATHNISINDLGVTLILE